MRGAAALLFVLAVGCGGRLMDRARAAVTDETLAALEAWCGTAPVVVREHSAEELWMGRYRRAAGVPPPEGAVIDPETGDIVSFVPRNGSYLLLVYEVPGCLPPAVVVHCDERCAVVGDDFDALTQGHCWTY